MPKPTYQSAIKAIDKAGILLVFPIKNQTEPASLWSSFYPQKTMRWEWDESGDDAVVDLWHLRTELSESSEVVYTKWFRGRATFFSKPVFAAMLRALNPSPQLSANLTLDAANLLEQLLDDSPQSPKQLRRALDLRGRFYEATFNRATKELWERLLIVGYGEIDDGAFPSLAIGATRTLFEELWESALTMTPTSAADFLARYISPQSLIAKQQARLKTKIADIIK